MTTPHVVAGPPRSGSMLLFQDAHEFSPVRDVHGVERGSISRLATVLKRLADANEAPAILFGGDLAGGTLFGGLHRGVPFVQAFNELGVDVATFGQHDFDFGVAHTRDLVAASEFPWVSSDVITADGQPFLPEGTHGIVRAGELCIGIIGLTGSLQSSSVNAELTQIDAVAACRAALAELADEDVDVVVASAQTTRAEAETLMAAVPEIHVVLHEEHSAAADAEVVRLPDGRLIMTGQGDYGTVFELFLSVDEAGRVTSEVRRHAVDGTVDRDPAWFEVERRYADDLSARLEVQVAEAPAPLSLEQMGHHSADALRERLGADLGWMNGGGARATVGPGPVTLRNLRAVHPLANHAMLIEVTGAQLIDALEQGIDSSPEGHAGFPRPSGFRCTYSPSAPRGRRIIEVTLENGTPVTAGSTYTLGITHYVAVNGGDGVTAFQRCPVLFAPSEASADDEALIAHAQRLGTLGVLAPRVVARSPRGGSAHPRQCSTRQSW
jgi:5'-nucleotidase / UDP-sugar diphosphatase